MFRKHALTALLVFVLVFISAAHGQTAGPAIVISLDAADRPSIMIRDKAGTTLQLAARQLRDTIGRMTGARLELMQDGRAPDAGGFILCDVCNPVPPALALVPADRTPPAGSDAYVIRTGNRQVAVVGGSERAVLFGIYDLLERIGCRWFGPADEMIPRAGKLDIPALCVDEKPGLKWRGLELITGSNPAIADWMAKMRLNVAWPEGYTPKKDMTVNEASMKSQGIPDMLARGMTIFWGGHILPILFPIEKYKDHPEYFAQIKGKRLDPAEDIQNQNQLCISNPEVLPALARNTVEFLRYHPWIEVLFIWAGDTTQWCECDKCRALLIEPDKGATFGGFDRTPLYTRMIQAIAEGVERDLPGRKIAFNHYYNLENIPTDKEGNVLKGILPPGWVLSAVDDYHQCNRHPIRDTNCPRGKRIEPIAKMWAPHYEDSVSWSYYFAWNFMMGLPISEVRKLPDDFRFVRALGINGVIDNVTLNPGSLHWYNNQLNFYIYGKASWNPDLNVDETVADYIGHYYGPAAEPMANAWALLDEATRKFGLDPAFMPAESALARPQAIHGRMRDIEDLPAKTHGVTAARQVHYLVPNREVYDRLMGHLDEAARLAKTAGDAPYAYRVMTIRNVINGWDTEKSRYHVVGHLNGGGANREYLYDEGDETRCSVVSGNNLGDCFWPKPVGTEQLAKAGDSVQVRVKVNYGTERVGSPNYRSGPGLYHAQDQSTPCGAQGSRSLGFFIGNGDDDRSGPRRVIVQAHDGKFGTSEKRSQDGAWEYGQDVALRIDYLGKRNGSHAYRYLYDGGTGWVEVGVQTFRVRLPFVAPSFHFAVADRDRVKYPLIDWASFREFGVRHGEKVEFAHVPEADRPAQAESSGHGPATAPAGMFGFFNGGGEGTRLTYDTVDGETCCTLVAGNNIGDCFWPQPAGSAQLRDAGDAAQVEVRINADSAVFGEPLYRAGPGLYLARTSTERTSTDTHPNRVG